MAEPLLGVQKVPGSIPGISSYLKGCHLEEGRDQFHLAAEDRTSSNGFKVCVEQYQLDNREKISVRVVQQWNRLPKEVVSSPSLAVLKQQLDRYLSWML